MIIYIFFSNNITMSNHSFWIKTAISQRKLFLFFFPKKLSNSGIHFLGKYLKSRIWVFAKWIKEVSKTLASSCIPIFITAYFIFYLESILDRVNLRRFLLRIMLDLFDSLSCALTCIKSSKVILALILPAQPDPVKRCCIMTYQKQTLKNSNTD